MAPSPALQARIQQFEALEKLRSPKLGGSHFQARNIQSEQPHLTGSSQSSLLDEPLSPTAASYSIIQPSVPYVPRKAKRKSPSPSPPNLGLKTSLIDLKDWVLEDGLEARFRPKNHPSSTSKPVIAPPLPPRKASQSSNRASGVSSSKPRPSYTAPPIIPSRTSSNSLTVEHTYPPVAKSSSSSNLRQAQGHVSASSTSSFHSVSLSSDGGTDGSGSVSNFIQTYPMDKNGSTDPDADKERDRDSVDDSFSFVTESSTSVSSPTMSSTHDWEKDFSSPSVRPDPPKLPVRRPPSTNPPSTSAPPSLRSSSSTTSSPRPSFSANAPSSYVRRVPPPVPSRATKTASPSPSTRTSLISNTSASDRSSIFSTATVTTAHTSIGSYIQLLRPTPVPMTARKRYEALFFANVNAQRRLTAMKLSPKVADKSSASPSPTSPSTPRKGWRGLSVDLITNPEDIPKITTPEEEAESMRLDAQVVKAVWSKSKIQTEKLKDIWSECALPGQMSLDKDGFVKGMWRIDEELRRLQNVNATAGRLPPSRRTPIDSLLH